MCSFTGVIDTRRAPPSRILGLTQILAQLSVHMFLSVPDLTSHSGNPVNVTARPLKPLVLWEAAVATLPHRATQVTSLLSTATC